MPVAEQTVHDVDGEHDERDADGAAHGGVEPRRQEVAADDGGDAEAEDDEAVAGGVGRRDPEPAPGTRLPTRHVGDGGDVVPVDTVPDAVDERGAGEPDHEGAPVERRRWSPASRP